MTYKGTKRKKPNASHTGETRAVQSPVLHASPALGRGRRTPHHSQPFVLEKDALNRLRVHLTFDISSCETLLATSLDQ